MSASRSTPGADAALSLQIHWGPTRQNSRVARRAPSARLASFAQTTSGSTAAWPTQVPKPQSLPAMTFSRPTRSRVAARSAGRSARDAR